MLIKYIEQKSYCVRSMQKLEKDGLWGPFQHSDLLLTVPVFYTFMAITCIHKFQTQFPTSQIDIYTTAYYIASLIGWVYISLSFFLEKKTRIYLGGRRKFHNIQLRTVDNLKNTVLSVYHHANSRARTQAIRIGSKGSQSMSYLSDFASQYWRFSAYDEDTFDKPTITWKYCKATVHIINGR